MQLIKLYLCIAVLAATMCSCEKLVSIDDPVDTITTTQVFSTDEQAKSAMAGLYTVMINGEAGSGGIELFGAGMATLLGSLSSDDLITSYQVETNRYNFNQNKLLADNALVPKLWNTAYKNIYNANSIVEGIEASTSSRLSEGMRKKSVAEAKFIRAFCYFYLTNFFGDVPLALTVDFNKTRNYKRTSQADVYKQIIEDLTYAQQMLPDQNTGAAGDRIYPDKWAASALLARTYLYTGDYVKAYKHSNDVISNVARFGLEQDLTKVFLSNSKEAIWQLKQADISSSSGLSIGNATSEGYFLIPSANPQTNIPLSVVPYYLSDQLLNAFESKDKRKQQWIGRSDQNQTIPLRTLYWPYKYKIGSHNHIPGAPPTELYMMLRLGEQYLIRAEAAINGAAGLTDAIDDLNEIRRRAGVDELQYNLSAQQVTDAIAHERQVELFVEWGHRWLDLKRTNKASEVLRQLPVKQPWAGDYQLLYPIPLNEMLTNKNLEPNPGYF